MKKLLAIILTLALLLGFAMPALANDPPAITHITAQWNGEIVLQGQLPHFGPDNVAVTVYYSDNTSRVLDYWGDYRLSDRAHYAVIVRHAVGWVTITVNNRNGIIERASFEFPENYREIFINNHRPLPEFVLGETASVSFSDGPVVFAFTPQTDARHRIQLQARRGQQMMIWTPDFAVIFDNFGNPYITSREMNFVAGQTYYIVFLDAQPSHEEPINVTITPVPPPSLWSSMLVMILMPLMMPAGLVGLMLPLAVVIVPLLPVFAALTIALSPFTALLGLLGWLIFV